MKNGFRVYDSDTHVNPAAEVLERYVDPDFRPRLAELAPYRLPIGQAVEGPNDLHNYRVGTKYYRRILGERRRARPSPAARSNGWAARCRGRACRTTRPRTASRTWTTKAPMSIS